MKKLISVILILTLVAACFVGCADKNQDESASVSQESDYGLTDPSNPVATITMKDGGVMKIELFYNIAPNTVENFISLANSGISIFATSLGG